MKQTTAIAMLIVLTIGLSYSQVCDFTCALGKCEAPASSNNREQAEADHCHQEGPGAESGSVPQPSSSQGHKGERECPGHIDASTLRPAGVLHAFTSHDRQEIHALIARGFQALSGSYADSGVSNKEPPLRPPPTRSVLRI
ncbi:MAG TPA: hypothetical protein VE262_15490 [Blastocatellia bacterium]|nr:hypothetical protein [Blastocatellia bacterium]